MKSLLFRQRGWAFADQFTVSAGNFLTQLILARTLAPQEYGTYAVLIATVLFLNGLHGALVIFPIYIRCASQDALAIRMATSAGLAVSPLFGLVLAIPLVVAALLVGRPDLIVPVIFAMIGWQAQEAVRGSLLTQVRQREAISGDAISYLGQCVLLATLVHFSALTLPTTFAIIGLTSLVATAVQLSKVGYCRLDLDDVKDFYRHSIRVGRLGLPAKIISFFTVQSLPWALELGPGAAAAAGYQALSNVLGGVNPLLLATGSLVTASVANARNRAALIHARGHCAFGLLAVTPWLTFVMLFPNIALTLFYGHSSPYVSAVGPLRIMVIALFLEGIALPATCVMTGLGQMRMFLTMQAVGALTFFFCSFSIFHYGLTGAAATLVAIQVARVFYGVRHYFRTLTRSSELTVESLESVVNA